jgi:hypothetical protein
MAPIKSNSPFASYFDFFSKTGKDAVSPVSPPPVEASGGNINGVTPGNGYKYHVFTGNGNFVVTQGGVVEILLVGGGGPSGTTINNSNVGTCAGGGGGGVVHAPVYTIGSGTHPIVIGDPAPQPITPGTNRGEDSTFVDANGPTTITALGGGEGNSYNRNSGDGYPGGSGGGGGYPGKPGGTAQQPTQNPGISGLLQYGNAGGRAYYPEGGDYMTGGGGGSGAVGQPGNGPGAPAPGTAGAGGAGQSFSGFPGALPGFGPLPSAWKTAVAPQGYFAGGGGGGRELSPPTQPGGVGGGGPAGSSATAGVTNTGGGGGGINSPPSGPSGPVGSKGGSGIVVIRYQT